MAKQMVKERQDITGSNCLKGVSGKVIIDEKGIKDSWKEYMEKLMNEEHERDHGISAEKDQQTALKVSQRILAINNTHKILISTFYQNTFSSSLCN